MREGLFCFKLLRVNSRYTFVLEVSFKILIEPSLPFEFEFVIISLPNIRISLSSNFVWILTQRQDTGLVTSKLASFACKIIGKLASIDRTRPVVTGGLSETVSYQGQILYVEVFFLSTINMVILYSFPSRRDFNKNSSIRSIMNDNDNHLTSTSSRTLSLYMHQAFQIEYAQLEWPLWWNPDRPWWSASASRLPTYERPSGFNHNW